MIYMLYIIHIITFSLIWFRATIPQTGTEFKTLSKLADPKASTLRDPGSCNKVVGACKRLEQW